MPPGRVRATLERRKLEEAPLAKKQPTSPPTEPTEEPGLGNGSGSVAAAPAAIGQYTARRLLDALKTLKQGDFGVRLSLDDTVVGAAIAEAFNDVADLLEYEHGGGGRIANVVGKEGRITQRANVGAATGGWAHRIDSMNTLIGDLVRPTEEVARVIGAVAKGDLSQRIPLEHDGIAPQGRVPPGRPDRQHDGRPARLVRLGGHPRGPRGRHRGEAGRPGRGPGRRRDLEGPDRQRQLDGRQPHRPGAEHRPGDHRRRQRRPLQEDHRRRAGRDPGAEGHHQHDGRPARLVRLGGDPRRARGGLGRPARRPGAGARGGRASGRTSPTASTAWPATSPARSATSPRSPPPSPTATSPRRSPST